MSEVEAEVGATDPGLATPYEFDEAFQTKVVALNLRDPRFGQRTDGLVLPEYLSRDVDAAITVVANAYRARHKRAPGTDVLGSVFQSAVRDRVIPASIVPELRARLPEVMRASLADADFVADEVARFARERAVDLAMDKAIRAKAARGLYDYDKVQAEMKAALAVGLREADEGYDYWASVEERRQERVDRAAGVTSHRTISTGFPKLDAFLYGGGWGRQELSLFLGGLKAGKSMALGHCAVNASIAGHNVLYVSLEVSTETMAERLDANVSNTPIRDLETHPNDVAEAIEKIRAKGRLGLLRIHRLPAYAMKPSQLRRILADYRQAGVTFDLIVVDYADIMAPEIRDDVDRNNSRSIYADLRNIAIEEDAAVLSATQSNREGMKAHTAKATDVAEDVNKGRTCDIMISLNATEEERDAGVMRLAIVAARRTGDGITIEVRQARERMRFIEEVIGRC